jgi:toxin-antitoxin system PIN domain toxin
VTTYLLDANVLIALTVEEHEHHPRVAAWLAHVESVALCPMVEGSLVRFLVRIGESAGVAAEVLRLLHANPRCEFWPDAVSYADADISGVRGHRQVTDAYLVALVASRGDARLATLDRALAQGSPERTAFIAER